MRRSGQSANVEMARMLTVHEAASVVSGELLRLVRRVDERFRLHGEVAPGDAVHPPGN